MLNQTPQLPTDDQYNKVVENLRAMARKRGITCPGFQGFLGNEAYWESIGQMLETAQAAHVRSLPIFERPPIAVINVGTFKSVGELAVAADKAPFQRSSWAKDLMSRPAFTIVSEPGEIELYEATTAEILGHADGSGGYVRDIFAALEAMGAVKLPPEAGPQYRIQYPNQPLNEWRFIYMDPIADSDGYLEVFGVARYDDGLWLDAYYADPDDECSGDDRWVFARKHQS